MRRVGAGPAVEDEQLAVLQVSPHLPGQPLEHRRLHRQVHRAPVHLLLDARLGDDEAVLGGAAGVLAGQHDERAGVGQVSLAAADRHFDQDGGGVVGVNRSRVDESLTPEIDHA